MAAHRGHQQPCKITIRHIHTPDLWPCKDSPGREQRLQGSKQTSITHSAAPRVAGRPPQGEEYGYISYDKGKWVYKWPEGNASSPDCSSSRCFPDVLCSSDWESIATHAPPQPTPLFYSAPQEWLSVNGRRRRRLASAPGLRADRWKRSLSIVQQRVGFCSPRSRLCAAAAAMQRQRTTVCNCVLLHKKT